MKRVFSLFVLGALALTTGCRRDVEDPADAGDTYPMTISARLTADVAWANTGVKLRPHQRIRITPAAASLEDALGRDEANFSAPVPMAGAFALLVRLGENGLPVPVGEGIELQAGTSQWGESLFVGRNGSPSDFAEAQTTETTEDVTLVSKTVLNPIDMQIELTATDGPALLAPVPGFFTSNVSPTFDWDDIEDAFKYVFELSRFPDFRDQVLSVELSTGSSLSLANLSTEQNTNGQPTIPGQNNPAATLTEGVYFWRVRAQQNIGRTIAPEFNWTAHSPVGTFGIETRAAVAAPRILAPVQASRFSVGVPILLEFTANPDASGLFWRYKGFTGACGTTLDTASSQEVVVSPWFVFRKEYASNFIGEVPQRYAAATLESLDTGEHLYEVEIIDGADGRILNAARMGRTSVAFSVGCQN